MKKFFLFLLLILIGNNVKATETYHTLDLVGTWELVSCTGDYPGFTMYTDGYAWNEAPAHFKFMHIGLMIKDRYPTSLYGITQQQSYDVIHDVRGNYGDFYLPNTPQNDSFSAGDDGYGIRSFSLQDNILYLTLGESDGDWTILFLIESLSDQELILRGFDDMCRIVYKRVGTSEANQIIAEDNFANPQFYNLNGTKIKRPDKGIVIEKKGNRMSKKVLTE